ncbi:MAG TPA: helix-turn-helix domain-containing protein [Candidatus Binatus sp.]|uniref:helix-turn-helix domain-containing protein n=1 Tax=Candidatus Binatus sp. TaxID=2811406 RepID=UPI002B49E802|nr:helix-turn-helix domain-containing protein [Candidatus Binatus sp.]HKN12799.1 helix-turn-helix domain-containing protein [Candidatus Binatus sp.]
MIGLDAILEGADLESLRPDDIAALLCRLAAAQTRLAALLAGSARAGEDHLLDVDEAAQKLGVDRQWLYRRTKRLPFVVRLDGQVRYSAVGLERFIASRRGK